MDSASSRACRIVLCGNLLRDTLDSILAPSDAKGTARLPEQMSREREL